MEKAVYFIFIRNFQNKFLKDLSIFYTILDGIRNSLNMKEVLKILKI